MESTAVLVLDREGRVLKYAATLDMPRELLDDLGRFAAGLLRAARGISELTRLGPVSSLTVRTGELIINIAESPSGVLVLASRQAAPGSAAKERATATA